MHRDIKPQNILIGYENDGLRSPIHLLHFQTALLRVLNAITARQDYLRNKREELAATDALIARRFTPRCQFDRTHDRLLFDLAVDPARVSWFWKWRERLHRKFRYEHKGQP